MEFVDNYVDGLNDTMLELNETFANYQYEMSRFEKEGYIYPIEALLERDISQIGGGRIHVCPYQVNMEGLSPFLQFFLLKNQPSDKDDSDLIRFHSFDYANDGPVMLLCDSVLNIIFSCFKKADNLHVFKGFIKNGTDYFLFYDCSLYQIDVHHLYRSNDIWTVLMDEIVHSRTVCDFKISSEVTDLFSRHVEASYLLDNKGRMIETPSVVYSPCIRKQLDFISVFGVPKKDDNYYYFTDYASAVRSEEFDGMNRIAVFLGKMKVKESDLDLDLDLDSNELWDSVYKTNENGEPVWMLNRYEQQTTLTSHYKKKDKLV
jgi:hypothetical protein